MPQFLFKMGLADFAEVFLIHFCVLSAKYSDWPIVSGKYCGMNEWPVNETYNNIIWYVIDMALRLAILYIAQGTSVIFKI